MVKFGKHFGRDGHAPSDRTSFGARAGPRFRLGRRPSCRGAKPGCRANRLAGPVRRAQGPSGSLDRRLLALGRVRDDLLVRGDVDVDLVAIEIEIAHEGLRGAFNRAFFWTDERTTIPYDMWVIAILAFVWLVPPDWIRDPTASGMGLLGWLF